MTFRRRQCVNVRRVRFHDELEGFVETCRSGCRNRNCNWASGVWISNLRSASRHVLRVVLVSANYDRFLYRKSCTQTEQHSRSRSAIGGRLSDFANSLGKEGPLCAVLAFPIILAGLFIGIGIGVFFRWLFVSRMRHQTPAAGMFPFLVPVLIVAGERIEAPTLLRPRTEVIQTVIEVNDSPERVWRNILSILSIDNIRASRPKLMYVGLAIPQRCTIEEQGIGAKRACYFNAGYIEERVTGWNPSYHLGLSIDRTHMPGRHWLGF
jgi:hypothetical protein